MSAPRRPPPPPLPLPLPPSAPPAPLPPATAAAAAALAWARRLPRRASVARSLGSQASASPPLAARAPSFETRRQLDPAADTASSKAATSSSRIATTAVASRTDRTISPSTTNYRRRRRHRKTWNLRQGTFETVVHRFRRGSANPCRLQRRSLNRRARQWAFLGGKGGRSLLGFSLHLEVDSYFPPFQGGVARCTKVRTNRPSDNQ